MREIAAEQFGHQVDGVTLNVLNELIKRKHDKQRWQSKLTRTGVYLFLTIAVIVVDLVFFKKGAGFEPTLENIRVAIVSDPFLVILLVCLFVGMLRLRYVSKEHDDADDDLENLRLELIDRAEELFKGQEDWRERHVVFDYMKREHDINLFHK